MYWMSEVELQHSAIWIAGVYLMLLMQLLENKVAIDLTRSEFVEAQEVCYYLHLCYIWYLQVFFTFLYNWTEISMSVKHVCDIGLEMDIINYFFV